MVGNNTQQRFVARAKSCSVSWFHNLIKVSTEFLNEIEKKKSTLSTFSGWEVSTENYSDTDFYSYLQKNDLTYTY